MRTDVLRRVLAIGMLLSLGAAAAAPAAGDEAETTRKLALRLVSDGDHAGAAIEFRRLSLQQDEPARGVPWLWAAASEYRAAGARDRAALALDEADLLAANPSWCVSALRAALAGDARDFDVASFHWRSALDASPGPDEKTWTARRLSGAFLRDGDPEAAAEALSLSSRDESEALDAIRRYRQGRDRRPLVGGLLGLIPGLGYTYSGEYANAGRSLILNALFIWAMTYSAQEDQWGAFAVAGFFEVTWYSGSIYGGVDAAHRYNERRREDCARAIEGGATAEPDYPALPLMRVRIKF